MASNGKYFTLFRRLGWFSASPRNLTKREQKQGMRPETSEGNSGNGSGQVFDSYLRASSNPVERQNDMEEMMNSELGATIIELYAEECSQPDVSEQKILWYECNDSEIEEDLNKMAERIGSEAMIQQIAADVAGKGNHFRRILYNDDGVMGFIAVNHREIRRIWEPTSKRLLGWYWNGEAPQDPVFENQDDIFAPWDFVHFRRQVDADSEYGLGLIDRLYPLYKRLTMGMNQMTLYRLNVMPTRHLLMLDGGDQDFATGMEQVHMMQQFMRQKQMLNRNDFQSRFDTPGVDSIMYLPVRTNENTKYETMPGDKDVPDVYDMEYLSKCFYGGARVPKAYVGHGDDSSGLAQASLVSQDIRFARMIRTLRTPLITGFFDLACIHLALRGKNPDDYQIKVRMSKISALEEEVNAATLEKQINLAASLTGLCQDLEIPNREIIELVFKEYLHIPRKFVDLMKLSISVTQALNGGNQSDEMFGGMGGGGGGMGMGGMDDMGPPGEGGPDAGLDEPLEAVPQESARKPANLTESARTQKLLGQVCAMIRTAKSKLNESEISAEMKARFEKARLTHVHALGELYRIKTSKKCSLTETLEERPGNIVTRSIVESIASTKRTSDTVTIAMLKESAAAMGPKTQEALVHYAQMRSREEHMDTKKHPSIQMVEGVRRNSKPKKKAPKKITEDMHKDVSLVQRARTQTLVERDLGSSGEDE